MSHKRALLIGNCRFDALLPPLHTAEGDIAALAKVLGEPAIGAFDEVTPILDATSTRIRREIARFLANRGHDDLLLLYFSGHGLLDERGALYLAVQDTEPDLLSATAVPAAFVTCEMDHCRSRRQILILDCCYSGAFERGSKGGATAIPATTFEGNGIGRVVLTASNSTQLAWEESSVGVGKKVETSVFTRHLIQGLESGEADIDGDGFVTVDELYDYVYTRVVEENPRQTPGKWSYRQQGGDLVLARSQGRLRPLPQLPPELRQALDSPLAAVREGAVRELARFLRGSEPALSEPARKAAEQALDDDSRRVAMAAADVLAAAVPASAQVASLPVAPAAPLVQASAPIGEDEHPAPRAPIAEDRSVRIPPPTVRRPRSPWRVHALGWVSLSIFAVVIGVVMQVATRRPLKVEKRDSTAIVARPATAVNAHPTEDPERALLVEARSWPVAFADHFDSAKASGKTWGFGSGDGITDASSEVSSGVLRLGITTTGKIIKLLRARALPATAGNDSYLRVEVTRVWGKDAAGGLIFRASKEGTPFYCFLIRGEGYLVGVQTDKLRWLQPWTRSPVIRPPGQTNSLAVLAKGSRIVCFINDKIVYQARNFWAALHAAVFGSGPAGVAVVGVNTAIFDFANFELRLQPAADPAMGTDAMGSDSMGTGTIPPPER